MLILGIILLVVGFIIGSRLLAGVGAILALVGLALDLTVWHVGTALF
jgi:hypothetical protein